MRLVIYNKGQPGTAHVVKTTASRKGYQCVTQCGRGWPGVLGQLTIFSNDLHLCGVCEIVVRTRKLKRADWARKKNG